MEKQRTAFDSRQLDKYVNAINYNFHMRCVFLKFFSERKSLLKYNCNNEHFPGTSCVHKANSKWAIPQLKIKIILLPWQLHDHKLEAQCSIMPKKLKMYGILKNFLKIQI